MDRTTEHLFTYVYSRIVGEKKNRLDSQSSRREDDNDDIHAQNAMFYPPVTIISHLTSETRG